MLRLFSLWLLRALSSCCHRSVPLRHWHFQPSPMFQGRLLTQARATQPRRRAGRFNSHSMKQALVARSKRSVPLRHWHFQPSPMFQGRVLTQARATQPRRRAGRFNSHSMKQALVARSKRSILALMVMC